MRIDLEQINTKQKARHRQQLDSFGIDPRQSLQRAIASLGAMILILLPLEEIARSLLGAGQTIITGYTNKFDSYSPGFSKDLEDAKGVSRQRYAQQPLPATEKAPQIILGPQTEKLLQENLANPRQSR